MTDFLKNNFARQYLERDKPHNFRRGVRVHTKPRNTAQGRNALHFDSEYSQGERPAALEAFQTKLASLRFLDPACGSGNFLTETYLSLRRLENKVISALYDGGNVLGFGEFIKVKINQFYGIEINDFAVTVAKTALWIAESQMVAETEAILSQTIDFLPLTTNAFIVEGNALRMDWSTLRSEDTGNRNELPLFQFTAPPDSSVLSPNSYDYIMGNPPFVGARLMSESQKSDVSLIWQNAKNLGKLADLYDETLMPQDLRKAHRENDKAVMAAYGFKPSMTESEIVAELFKMYEKLVQKA